jgi:hypothetical protein
VLVRGVYIDAEEPAGQCVIFPVYYIRLFFQKERTKKQKRLMEKLEKVDHQDNSILLVEKPLMNHATSESAVKTKIINIPENVLDLNELKNNNNSDNDNHNVDDHKVLVTNE